MQRARTRTRLPAVALEDERRRSAALSAAAEKLALEAPVASADEVGAAGVGSAIAVDNEGAVMGVEIDDVRQKRAPADPTLRAEGKRFRRSPSPRKGGHGGQGSERGAPGEVDNLDG